MRKKSHTMLNRMSPWQYALLLLMLVTFTFYSLPTFFGEQPSLGLHGQTRLSGAQQRLLQEHQIAPQKQIEQKERIELVFATQAEQQRAKQLLEQQGVDSAALTLEFHSNAPTWISQLGADPIKLGLDLRGGSQLLIGVDVDFVIDNQTKNLVDTLRTRFREANLRGASVMRTAQGALAVTLPDVDGQEGWLTIIKESAGTRQDQWKLSRSGNELKLVLSESERTLLVNNAVTQNLSILKKRINELGIVEASVQRQGQDGIRIELPGVHNPKQAKEVIGATASLAFYEAKADSRFFMADRNGQAVGLARKPVLSGEHIVDARANMGEMGQPQVNIVLDTLGGSKMNQFSRQHVGKPMATVFTEYKTNAEGKLRARSEVINVATIQTALGNQFRITGIGSLPEAQELAMLLRAGALTAPLKILEERSIGPTLGLQNIEAGFTALAFGMAGMMLFMMAWYRKFGWVAITALIGNLLMQVGMLAVLPGAVLTLPGIAGLVLTVGMAVDTHVLIFERIKDRLREGGSLANAIDFGYRSAFRTIFDANITTLICAVVLYAIGSGPLQGFSITLILGLISSMVTGIWGTRAIINPLWGNSRAKLLRV
ncbi:MULTISPECIES: protein translocase subunit SecD [Aeromonas]|uniref:Protein translocase subunit SecD n=1 Tax=Aeromonas rivipollensis TaxID=948519 RepID=A0AAW9YFM2_9GAMM|nr:protein translocase subunit SecD [Aeromonas rivipollensis]MDM5091768.1 protein translocase subunit SecD [Aeromonas rivipollensis]NEX76434.1 protein translocase subunit SecD [Aeromonas rivipollensis]NEX83243.1 protein translocase subunit SecD [Aeromonas rivipollensis]NEX89610.1 protein translocase subunit SecD [Aeromonas rivipollensis]NEY06273.1 protein translocase subunit SecD [Aeromonas rivipollensis]